MRPRRCGNSRYGTLETTSSSCRTRLKHPYKHPYGIAPCDPPRLKRAQSTQIGSHDTGIPRIRYAVPPLRPSPDSCSNRADFGLMGGLEHPYQHPYALAPVAAMVDDRHKMWCRISLPAPDVVAARSVKPSVTS